MSKQQQKIRNIVLDMGNVLLDFNPEVPLRAFLPCEEDRAPIRKELFEGPEWPLHDKGDITAEEMYERVAARVPARLHEGLKRCAFEWLICMKPLAPAVEFCAAMKEKGYPLYVLSNAADNFYDYFENFAPREYFNGILYSAEVKILKPDPGIYQAFFERFGLVPNECLFIDDREINVEGARRAGMFAEVYRENFAEIAEKYDL